MTDEDDRGESGESWAGETGPLDVATLEVLGRRAASHALVEEWALRPGAIAPRRLRLTLDDDRYPSAVAAARIDIRWYESGDYCFHYVEERPGAPGDAGGSGDGGERDEDDGASGDRWQCRWDRHPEPEGPRAHRHPPPDAQGVEPSDLDASHHLGVLFAVLERIAARVERAHEG